MKVFVVGGTGFIGYHTVLKLIEAGHEVATLSLKDIELPKSFPSEAKVRYGDVFKMSEEELISLFNGYDTLIYSVGPDDRVTPPAPAYQFFYDRLVNASKKVLRSARKAGVKRSLVMGSYFAYFDRKMPGLKLRKTHPYIKCRVEQEKACIEEGKNTMDVLIYELPYIFGVMPGRDPLWKDLLIKRLIKDKTIYYPRGGSAMVDVEGVANACVAGLKNGKHGMKYQIGGENFSWDEMIKLMLKELNMEHKKIRHLPKFVFTLVGRSMRKKEREKRLESGLNLNHLFSDIMGQEFYFNSLVARNQLKFDAGDVKEAIRKTVMASR